jgi:peptidoglycan-N-acetylglucosamine deacetylase
MKINKYRFRIKMKILQSWDDGIIDDVRLVELLRKYNATATFNLNIGLNENERVLGWNHRGQKDVWRLGRKEMPELYEGFEIAGHSMTHPRLTQCSDDQIQSEIYESRKILQDMFNQSITGFCYPFGDFDEKLKDILKDAGYTHARGIERADNVFPPKDPFEFNPHCHFKDENFYSIYENAKKEGSEYFFFWGHSYEFFNENMWSEFEQKLQIFVNDSSNEWYNISRLF